MTAHPLPFLVAHPFIRHDAAKPAVAQSNRATDSTTADISSEWPPPFCVLHDRPSSPSSPVSVASAPAPRHTENAKFIQFSANERSLLGRPAVQTSNPCHLGTLRRADVAVDCHRPSRRATSDLTPSPPRRSCNRPPHRVHDDPSELKPEERATHKREQQIYSAVDTQLLSEDPGRADLPICPTRAPIEQPEPEVDPSERQELTSSVRWNGRHSDHADANLPPRCLAGRTKSTRSQGTGHKKRLSTVSSAFVHTVKTASLSNTSVSNVPRSLRVGRSTDSYGWLGSHNRHSIESDRPGTTSSVDEAAFRRSLKRRQILAELVTTEESYVADLKALLYLYSTLLASTVTVSSRMRTAIQRNVHDLLHIHERLLERLHQAAYDASVRKWADTKAIRNLGIPARHRRWRSLESDMAVKFGRHHRRTGSSVDSSEMTHGRNFLGSADPADVADIASVFEDFLGDFTVYEEYCANHGLIAGELHRHVPTLWSTFESGIEALARSLVALDHKRHNERKGLTVGDLLIKPIQRITKYPLLFDDLLKQTPVADCPSTHSQLEATRHHLREVVQLVNHATDNREARRLVQRRWALQSKLAYAKVSLKPEQFRVLGNVQLCGVLHVAWQSRTRVDGRYALCVLFAESLLVAFPAGNASRFEVMAFLHLSALRVESATDGRGLQCPSTLYTWKICFEVQGSLHEFILSACSAAEEGAWRGGMDAGGTAAGKSHDLAKHTTSCVGLELRSIASVYGPSGSCLSRNPSVQRAATVGNRASVSQVIIRNTHNPHDLHDFRQSSAGAINRSQSHLSSNRIVVLSPKRSDRARLESALGDVWTKEKLPYPGMVGSRGGQIIRASAGSLVRKLSLASIHAPFSRRSGSFSLSSRKSYDGFADTRATRTKSVVPVFEVRKESFDDLTPARTKSHDLPELDTMDSVVHRMIGNALGQSVSLSSADRGYSMGEQHAALDDKDLGGEFGPDVVTEPFPCGDKDDTAKKETVEEGLGHRKKRWSNPLGILKGLSAEGFRHMLYSSR